MSIAPSGRTFDMEGYDWVRVERGRIAEHWGVTDQLRMMTQLRVLAPQVRTIDLTGAARPLPGARL